MPVRVAATEDTAPMVSLVDELMDGRVDVIAFTSQVQIRHLYKVAAANDVSGRELSDALNRRTIVCGRALPRLRMWGLRRIRSRSIRRCRSAHGERAGGVCGRVVGGEGDSS